MSAGTANGKPKKPEPHGDPVAARLIRDILATRLPLEKADRDRLAPPWGDGALLAYSEGMPGVDRWLASLKPDAAARCRAALDAAQLVPEPDTIKYPTPPPGFSLGVMGMLDFAAKQFPREYLVSGLLVANRPAILAGPKKSLKTTLLVDLLVSLAAADPFLGEFHVPNRVKTLLISGESGEATIQETMRRVCRSKGLDPLYLEGFAFWGFTLPQLCNTDQVEALAAFIKEQGIQVVIIDPVYLSLIGGPKVDPANLFDVGPLLKRIADACLQAGATPILAHHFRKNRENPFDPPELEDIAFAGFQEFARQWLLIGRRRKYEPGSGEHDLWVSVGGSDGHSGEWAVDIREGITDEGFKDREWGVKVHRASEARDEAKAKAEAAKAEKLAEKSRVKETAKEADERKALEAVLEIVGKADGRKMTATAIRTATGWRKDKVDRILFRLTSSKVLVPDTITVTGGNGATKDHPALRLAEMVSE